jgi:hypothetical protein
VTKAEDLQRLVAETVKAHGGVDIVVPNAGIARVVSFADSTAEACNTQFSVNLFGAIETVRLFLPHIRKGGSVQFITTFLTQVGFPGLSIYSASKAALKSFSQTLAAELAPQGIRVNSIAPGPIGTPLWGTVGLPPEVLNVVAANVTARLMPGAFGQPEDIAKKTCSASAIVTPCFSFFRALPSSQSKLSILAKSIIFVYYYRIHIDASDGGTATATPPPSARVGAGETPIACHSRRSAPELPLCSPTEPPSSSHSPRRPLTVVTRRWHIHRSRQRPGRVVARADVDASPARPVEARHGDEAGAEVALHQGFRNQDASRVRTPAGAVAGNRTGRP